MIKLTSRSVTTCTYEELEEGLGVYFEQDVPMHGPGGRYDWALAQNQCRYYGNTLSFMYGLHAQLAVAIRHTSKKDEKYTDLAGRRDIINDCIEAVKAKYDSLSRSYTMFSEEYKRASSAN
jgi:hypothetical protein